LTLGASRTRLIQQLVVESAVLAVTGAVLACVVAYWAMRGLVLIAPAGTPFVDQIGFDGRVFAATMIVSTGALLVFGLVPAFASSGVRLGLALKDRTAGAGSSRHVMRLRHLLVVAEVAAAVVLLVAASLFVRSLGRLTHVDAGVDLDRVVTGRLSLPAARYTNAQRSQFYAELTTRLGERPDVESAAAASYIPAGTGGFGLGRVFVAEGRPEPPAAPDTAAQWNSITPGYFRTVGIRVTAGRAFTDQDRADTTPVIIVTQDFAQRAFPGESPLGKRVRSWRDENVLREIVGVVSSVKYARLSDRDYPLVYVPYAQDVWTSMLVAVRAKSGDPAPLGLALRDAVKALDPLVAVARVSTMSDAARASIATERYGTLLLGLLAATALGLAALGVYSVINYVFLLRRREMGIRVALGASSSSIYALVFRYGLILTSVGLAIGAAGAAAASRAIGSLLYNTSAADGLAWVSMIGTIVVAACVACLWPASQAAKADAMEALRAE
jgi:predicted permease